MPGFETISKLSLELQEWGGTEAAHANPESTVPTEKHTSLAPLVGWGDVCPSNRTG